MSIVDDWGVGGEEFTEIPEAAPSGVRRKGKKKVGASFTREGKRVGENFGKIPKPIAKQPPRPEWMSDSSKLPKVPPCRR